MIKLSLKNSARFILIFLFVYILLKLLFNKNQKSQIEKNENETFEIRDIRFDDLDYSGSNLTIFISYTHHLDTSDKLSIDNFKYFLHFAYVPCSDYVYFKINLNLDSVELNVKTELLKLVDKDLVFNLYNCKNTAIILRENRGSDICSIVKMFNSNHWKRVKSYFKYFFFINSSVRGPFLPNYWTRPWWDIFLDMFKNNQRLVCAGPYLSLEVKPHIQSFMSVLDLRGVELMEKAYRCPYVDEDRQEWINKTEVYLGEIIIENGYEMQSLLAVYNGRKKAPDFKPFSVRNPFHEYPLTKELKRLFYESKKKSFLRKFADFFESFDDDIATANIHELTWVKYNRKLIGDMSDYTKKYVPLYTEIQYKVKNFKEIKKK